MSKKNNLWKLLYAVLMIIFVVYLFVADSIVITFRSVSETMTQISFENIANVQVPRAAVDSCDYLGGMNEEFYAAGWGFCETDKDNSDKQISIVFRKVDSDVAYSYTFSEVNPRPDVYEAFSATTKIKNSKADFRGSFSTFGMITGVYEVYIHVIENDEVQGVVSVKKYFKKTASGMEEVNADGSALTDDNESTTKVETSLEKDTFGGKGYIDSANYSGGTLSISGWGTLALEYNRKQQIYVAVTDSQGATQYYRTQCNSRTDLVSAFGDSSYADCGFIASIKPENLSGEIKLSLVIGVDGKYYSVNTEGVKTVTIS